MMKQIDYLKAISIISVIILHTLPVNILNITLCQFHIWNAVPIFIILSSFTTYISCDKKKLNLKELYNLEYIIKKIKRIIYPIIYVFIITLLIGIIFNKEIYIGFRNLIAYMPVTGPGNYYITLLLQYIIISPLCYYLYKKMPKMSLIISLIINVISEVLLYYVQDNYLYSSCLLRYTFLIFLGFYLFEIIIYKNKRLDKKSKSFLIIGLIVSISYMIIINFYSIPFFNERWKRQLFLADFYPLMIVYLGFKFLPNKLDKIINIGKWSYHIFLVQMVYFIINPIEIIFNKYLEINKIIQYPILIIFNCIICIFVGYLFYLCTNQIERYFKNKFNRKKEEKNEYISSNTSKRWIKRNT